MIQFMGLLNKITGKGDGTDLNKLEEGVKDIELINKN